MWSDAMITKEAARIVNTCLRDRRGGWSLALAQPPTHCGLLDKIQPFSRSSFPHPTKKAIRNKRPSAQEFLLQDSLTQIYPGSDKHKIITQDQTSSLHPLSQSPSLPHWTGHGTSLVWEPGG